MQIIIKNPLEQFEILDLFSISTSLLGYRFVLTNLGLYIIIITFLILIINYWITSESNKLLLHSYGSLIQESIYATILQMVKNQIGSSNEKYLPLIFTLFIFILFNNLIGMVPYSFTPTSHLYQIYLSLFFLVIYMTKHFY
jgi:F-type H+-transporting ATPase subunit a